MNENLPNYISVIFIITTLLTLVIFYWTVKKSTDNKIRENRIKIILPVFLWLVLQGILSFNNVYNENTDSIPPKIFLFGVLPNIIAIIWLFLSKTGKRFIDSLPIEKLTFLNLVRIPVELVLLWLFMNTLIPEIMTFEGWNFDIIMGITAPIIIYYGFMNERINRKVILIWNIIGLILLLFIFVIALLSAPFPLQRLAFDQPNIGLLYFPFSWLATFIVPIVILGHLVSIRKLTRKKPAGNTVYN
jgi:hypothetical protein